MSDGNIAIKVTGDAASAERAMAAIEKRVEAVEGKLTAAKSAAKTAAIAEKEALKAKEKAISDDAKISRDVLRTHTKFSKEQENQQTKDKRQAEKDKAKAVSDDARASRDVLRTYTKFHKEQEAEQLRDTRKASKEKAKAVSDDAKMSRDVLRNYTKFAKEQEAEQSRNKRAASMAAKRLAREEARERMRVAKEAERTSNATTEWLSGVTSAGLAYLGIKTVVGEILAAQKEVTEEINRTGQELDVNTRKMWNQLSLKKVEGEAAQKDINKIAIDNAVTIEHATKATIALGSSGFSTEEAKGSALDFILKLQASNNQQGQDPSQLVEAAGEFLASKGVAKTHANLEKYLIPMQRLSKPTDLKISDLLQIGGKSIGISETLKNDEHEIALQAMTRSYTTEDKSSTAAKQFVDRLATMERLPKARKWLAKMKLDPRDIDLAADDNGKNKEDLPTATRRLRDAHSKLSEHDQRESIKAMFGDEAGPIATGLMRDIDKFQELIEIQRDRKGFFEDADINQRGPAAAKVRNDAEKQAALFETAKKTDAQLIIEKMETLSIKRGDLPSWAKVGRERAESAQATWGNLAYSTSWQATGAKHNDRLVEAMQAVRTDKREPLQGLGTVPKYLLDEADKKNGYKDPFLQPIPAKFEQEKPAAAQPALAFPEKAKPVPPDVPRDAKQPVIPAETKERPPVPKAILAALEKDAARNQGGLNAGNPDAISQLVSETKRTNDLLKENNDLIRGEKPKPAEPPKRPKPVNASE